MKLFSFTILIGGGFMNKKRSAISLFWIVFGVVTLCLSTNVSAYSIRTILEYDHSNRSNSLLNPDNILEQETQRVEAISLIEETFTIPYLENGGNITAVFRADYQYLKGRSHSEGNSSSVFNELFYHKEIGKFAGSMGREKVRWGVGYSASPTDIITLFRRPINPDDRLQVLKGTDLFRISFSTEKSQTDLVYFPDVDIRIEDMDAELNEQRVGFRHYHHAGPAEFSLVAKLEERGVWAAGANATMTVGKALELHAEYLFTSSTERLYPSGSIVRPSYTQDGSGVHDLLIGANYTFKNQWNIVTEYLFSDGGFTDRQAENYYDNLRYMDQLYGQSATLTNMATGGLLGAASVIETPVRQHNIFTRLYKDNIFGSSFAFEWFSMINIEDGSGFQVLQPRYTAADWYDIYLRIENTWGGQSTGAGLALEDLSANIGMNIFLGN